MEDRIHNEFSGSTRAQNDENDLFSAIGKQVLGMKLDEEPAEDDRVKIVEEIESLCMSCEENVSLKFPRRMQILSQTGYYSIASNQDSILS